MKMVSVFSFSSIAPNLDSQRRYVIYRSPTRRRVRTFQCNGKNPTTTSSSTDRGSQSENLLLKAAWYGSELLGIAASFLRSPSNPGAPDRNLELADDRSEVLDRTQVVETIKEDFQRSYFVTGNLTLNAYEEDCEFADPAGSFRGLRRFKRNCSNFGSLIERSNMKLMKWEDFEDKGIGHWRFSCILSFPWRPILSATGYTEYYFDAQSGRVCRHVEHWNVPKMALLKQILRPSRGLWGKRRGV
ncbi:PREDICTED: uncharacterized protein LOC104600199 [Nelumbo nucifera]|uniref:Uncharacterized protein n=2 Tax=Nelumbo nucifera TaxID=4432 RepID=A0A822XIS0_NELNU|nr:PREDICTED: uncharacterized protein LOC104600199 [Nelumbo nucifera]DAD19021.1 TPA_asm: hypothetical protein HUJ06_020484 [Nelumbo nucifera]